MKKIATGVFAAVLAGAISAPAFAAADPNPAQAIEAPEDVVIRAKRMKLYQMRMEMVEVEDKFYAKYNELNTDDNYDVVCTFRARTGQIQRMRRCEPVFVERLKGHYAADLRDLSDPFRTGQTPHIPTSPDNQLFAHWLELRDHAIQVINKSPELRKMIRHREALEQSYKVEQKARLNGRLILVE